MDQNKNTSESIDELVNRIDAFMKKGGGHMNVKHNGEGSEIKETRCATCCGEFADSACNTPASK